MKVENHHGKDSKYTKGIWFPDDAIINSEKYCKVLCDISRKKGVTIKSNSSPVKDLK
jgi:glycine/D-amino acid oxidase-like deaminating enzyme